MGKIFKIKLIFAPIFDGFRMSLPPLGMATLTSYIRNQGYTVDQDDLLAKVRSINSVEKTLNKKHRFDLDTIKSYKKYINYLVYNHKNKELNELVEGILTLTEYKNYDVIGFSVHSIFQFLYSLLLAKKIKEETGTIIVFGGTLITLYGHLFLKNFDFIDFMIVGDGEVPVFKLLEHLKFKKYTKKEIPGLVYRENKKIKINLNQKLKIGDILIPDFVGLPLELYKLKIKNHKTLILPYQIKKGCDNRCSFCTHHTFSGHLQIKPTAKVIFELKILKEKFKTNYFYFCDSTFNTTYEHTEELCDAIINSNLNIYWGGLGRTCNADKKLLEKIKRSGCVFLRYGIESGCDKITENIQKNFTVEQAARFLRKSYEAGILNIVSIIAGYPYETKEDIYKTIQFLKQNSEYIYHANSGIFFLECKSLMMKNPKKYGLTNLNFRLGSFFENPDVAETFSKDNMDLRMQYAFDEINGLPWKFKKYRQRRTRNILRRVIEQYINSDFVDNTSFKDFFNARSDDT